MYVVWVFGYKPLPRNLWGSQINVSQMNEQTKNVYTQDAVDICCLLVCLLHRSKIKQTNYVTTKVDTNYAFSVSGRQRHGLEMA